MPLRCGECCARVDERRHDGTWQRTRCSITGRLVNLTAPCHLTPEQAARQAERFGAVASRPAPSPAGTTKTLMLVRDRQEVDRETGTACWTPDFGSLNPVSWRQCVPPRDPADRDSPRIVEVEIPVLTEVVRRATCVPLGVDTLPRVLPATNITDERRKRLEQDAWPDKQGEADALKSQVLAACRREGVEFDPATIFEPVPIRASKIVYTSHFEALADGQLLASLPEWETRDVSHATRELRRFGTSQTDEDGTESAVVFVCDADGVGIRHSGTSVEHEYACVDANFYFSGQHGWRSGSIVCMVRAANFVSRHDFDGYRYFSRVGHTLALQRKDGADTTAIATSSWSFHYIEKMNLSAQGDTIHVHGTHKRSWDPAHLWTAGEIGPVTDTVYQTNTGLVLSADSVHEHGRDPGYWDVVITDLNPPSGGRVYRPTPTRFGPKLLPIGVMA